MLNKRGNHERRSNARRSGASCGNGRKQGRRRGNQQAGRIESAIDETLASGYLDDTLTVTDADGVAQVLPVLDSEPISHLVEGLEAVGGSANVFVHTSAGVVALSVVEYKPNEEE